MTVETTAAICLSIFSFTLGLVCAWAIDGALAGKALWGLCGYAIIGGLAFMGMLAYLR